MLGDSGVGKTNIINNFVKGTAGNQPKGPTVGIEYSSKTIAIDSSRTIKMQIWDTAGQEQYRSLTTKYTDNEVANSRRRWELLWSTT